mmetsp:Transcript_63374/g.183567  ORF Transcript_63374/g.183567 Transcript_63374/m.183567 type:complete len:353 (+) Transcript_63374:1-1059(+)
MHHSSSLSVRSISIWSEACKSNGRDTEPSISSNNSLADKFVSCRCCAAMAPPGCSYMWRSSSRMFVSFARVAGSIITSRAAAPLVFINAFMSSAILPGATTVRSTTSTAVVRTFPVSRESMGNTSGCRRKGCFVSPRMRTSSLSSKSGGESSFPASVTWDGGLGNCSNGCNCGLLPATPKPVVAEPRRFGADLEVDKPFCDRIGESGDIFEDNLSSEAIAEPAAFSVWLMSRRKLESSATCVIRRLAAFNGELLPVVTIGAKIVFDGLRTCGSLWDMSSAISLCSNANRKRIESRRTCRRRTWPVRAPEPPPAPSKALGLKSPHITLEGLMPRTCEISSSTMRCSDPMCASP